MLDDRTEHGVPSGTFSDAREYVEPVTVATTGRPSWGSQVVPVSEATIRPLAALSILAHQIGRAVFYILSRGTVFSTEKFLAA